MPDYFDDNARQQDSGGGSLFGGGGSATMMNVSVADLLSLMKEIQREQSATAALQAKMNVVVTEWGKRLGRGLFGDDPAASGFPQSSGPAALWTAQLTPTVNPGTFAVRNSTAGDGIADCLTLIQRVAMELKGLFQPLIEALASVEADQAGESAGGAQRLMGKILGAKDALLIEAISPPAAVTERSVPR